VSFWNRAAERVFGYSAREAVGRDLHVLLAPPTMLPLFRQAFPAFQRTGTGAAVSKTLELNALRKDQTPVVVELSLSAMEMDGRWCAVGVVRDITERRQIEERLAKAQQETEAANRDLQRAIEAANQMAVLAETSNAAKSEFLANMSHEIRTPMNGVIGMLGLLLDTELTQEQHDFAATAQNSADALLVIINDILDFSKIEAGKLELENIDFDLQTGLEDVAELCAMRAVEKGLEFVLSVPPDVPRLLTGDPARLRQILVNLTGNAIKFTERGEVTVEASVVQSHDDHVKLRFEVRDTGIGIPADKLAALFRPFSQADASTTRRFGGTGLGLSISKQLANLMGGEIGVESIEGRGSLFWFTAILKTRAPAPQDAPPPLENVRGSRMLVVDDNETNRRVVGGMLRNWGCRFAAADGADEAMRLLLGGLQDHDPFQVAVIDMHMPGKDGEALGAEIRANPELAAKTRLIMLTSAGRRGDAQRLRELGFSAYLTKPVKQSQLHDCLATILNQAAAHVGQTPERLVTRHTLAEDSRLRARILLAEDNPTNQKVALGVLHKLGYHADVAANGSEAVAAWLAKPYDLILMDVQMPEMDGFQATAAIRAEEIKAGRSRTAIVAMTAHAMKGDRERCLFAGMDDYVAKPINPQDLARALKERLHGLAPTVGVAESRTAPVDLKEVFDPDALVNRLGGDQGLARSILESFVDDVRRQIDALGVVLAGDDHGAARRQAHAIKGAAANAGANALRATALAMETAAADGDLPRARATFTALGADFTALVQRLDQLGIVRAGPTEGGNEDSHR
jgi:PAS domain S-box-containing protein